MPKYLRRRCKEDRGRLLLVTSCERTIGNWHELKHHIPFELRENVFTVRVTEHCHRLPTEAAEFPPWRSSKGSCLLEKVLGNLL